jgi:hypothetical protein
MPTPEQGWNDIEQVIETPTKDELRISGNERVGFSIADEAASLSLKASVLNPVASGLLALPRLQENINPGGMGISIEIDATNAAHCMMGMANVMQIMAHLKADESSRAGRKA